MEMSVGVKCVMCSGWQAPQEVDVNGLVVDQDLRVEGPCEKTSLKGCLGRLTEQFLKKQRFQQVR